MDQYRFAPLSPGPDSIRLLRVLPNENETAPVQCELMNYSLQKLRKGTHLYEALSYVWGSPKETLPIFIGKQSLNVTTNLHAALVRLRDHFFERVLWIDSVCINQEDEREKEHQIQSMARIYSQATRVLVWLGEEANNSTQALEDIRSAAENASTPLAESGTNQEAILKLLERPWFRRVWVRQKIQSFSSKEIIKRYLDHSRSRRGSACFNHLRSHRDRRTRLLLRLQQLKPLL